MLTYATQKIQNHKTHTAMLVIESSFMQLLLIL